MLIKWPIKGIPDLRWSFGGSMILVFFCLDSIEKAGTVLTLGFFRYVCTADIFEGK